ncbi:hypothetical protein Tco_0101086, partial [Tanacetum coccineum]
MHKTGKIRPVLFYINIVVLEYKAIQKIARPLLDGDTIDELIDPRLGNCYSEDEVICMLQAASLCIKRDPYLRPRMSQVILHSETTFTLIIETATLMKRYVNAD